MKLAEARVAFRDRALADVFDLALRFVAVNGGVYARVALVTLLPGLAVSLAVGAFAGWRVSWAVSIPLALLLDAPFTLLASRLVFEHEVVAGAVIRAALKEAPRVFFARVLALGFIVAGLGCLLVPGVGLAAMSLFVGEAMLLERAKTMTAFTRAQQVAANATGDVVLGLFILAAIPIGAILLTDLGGRTLIGEVLQFRPPRAAWTEYGSALATIGLFAQVPYLATARFFLYLNVRTRTEGWDIQTRFAGLASRS
jgi:hypothetical protein